MGANGRQWFNKKNRRCAAILVFFAPLRRPAQGDGGRLLRHYYASGDGVDDNDVADDAVDDDDVGRIIE